MNFAQGLARSSDVYYYYLAGGYEDETEYFQGLGVDKIHQYGVIEVSRIYNLMNEIKKKLNFKGTLKEFNNLLRKRKDYESSKFLIEQSGFKLAEKTNSEIFASLTLKYL